MRERREKVGERIADYDLHYALCIMNYELRIMNYELRIMNYALRILHYEYCITKKLWPKRCDMDIFFYICTLKRLKKCFVDATQPF